MMTDIHIGMIGYGEVGKIFCAALKQQTSVISLAAWDAKFAQSDTSADWQADAAHQGMITTASMRQLCERATFVISAVTASNTLAVANEAAQSIRAGTYFLDLNSASPRTKREAAAAIERAGGHYVEAGVMTSVPPYGIRVPMLLGGKNALTLASQLMNWGMDVTVVSPEIGVASAIKMCRSIMIKGLEALVVESYSTALHYGVADQVLPTLTETFPQIDWAAQGAYFFSRVVQHGKRRAEEMRESAATVQDAGFAPIMASAIADKQAWVAGLASQGTFKGVPRDGTWEVYARALIDACNKKD